MHPTEKEERFPALRAHDFERAASVVDAITREPTADEIRDAAADFLGPIILSFYAPAADEVVAFLQLREHEWDVVGVVLPVAVEQHDDVAFCFVAADVHRRALAGVFLECDDANARPTHDALQRFVGGAIIDEHEFVFSPGERGGKFRLERRDIVLLIKERDDDGKHDGAFTGMRRRLASNRGQ